MNIKDIEFVASHIASLCKIPCRIYNDKKSIYYHYDFNFSVDPVKLVIDDILNKQEDIGYIITDDFFYYCFVKYNKYLLIYGPFRLIKPDNALISKMTLKLEISKDDFNSFNNAMNSINSISLESMLQSMCLLYFILYKKKISISDILIDNSSQIDDKIDKDEDIFADENYVNNTYGIESELYKIVTNGQVDKLKMWLKNAPAVQPGILSNDTLRHTKNTFIAAATLISRAAIKGNLDVLQALALSDLYIQKMELLNNSSDIYTLQMNMVFDYTKQVAKIHNKDNMSDFLIELNKYVYLHISDAIKAKDICKALFISKSALFNKIKKETNMTLSNYILSLKINEAKHLLVSSNRSITSISNYLGFSSQSHFDHVFKKITNYSPIEYKKYKKSTI